MKYNVAFPTKMWNPSMHIKDKSLILCITRQGHYNKHKINGGYYN